MQIRISFDKEKKACQILQQNSALNDSIFVFFYVKCKCKNSLTATILI